MNLAQVFDVEDREPAWYFHGRDEVLASFDRLCKRALGGRSGTTFLIQGAPGAGKTALIHQLCLSCQDWKIVHIKPLMLGTPSELAEKAGLIVPLRETQSREVGMDAKALGSFGASRTTTRSREYAGASTLQVLTDLAHDAAGVLLVLDEAQNVTRLRRAPPLGPRAEDTLDAIHNGELGMPAILLAGGLGQTREVFNQLGIARFQRNSLVNLGRLSIEYEHSVIRDWLIESGRAKGDVTPWINTISKETYGWPQHIINYAEPAAQVIQQNDGLLTAEGLKTVLEFGRDGKMEYYSNRTAGIDLPDQFLLGAWVVWQGRGVTASRDTIVRILDTRKRATGETAISVLDSAIARGVLAETDGGLHIPIPSMETWLAERFHRFVRSQPEVAAEFNAGLASVLPKRQLSTGDKHSDTASSES